MSLIIDRRALLRTVAGFTAASSLGAAAARGATAEGVKRDRDGSFASIDQALQRAVDDKTVAGVVALGANEKGIVYQGTFGKRRMSDGPEMTIDTVFWLLSMTKAVTATACMQLVERGKLRLDQPMAEVLPALAAPRVLEGFDASGKPRLRAAKRPITLRHLLTHTSGYTYSVWSKAISEYEHVTGMPDVGECKNSASAVPLEFDPGERWEYGIGMDWVGKVVEAVSDQSLEIYFRENIFAPLRMKDTGFLIGSEQKSRVATLYNRNADGSLAGAAFEIPQRPEFFMGGGGLFGTPRDYLAFLQMLLNGGTFNGARVLQPQTVTTMFQNHIGELNVTKMITAQPTFSPDFDQFPGMVHKWGLSFDINTARGPHGRSPGSVSWAGLLNTYFWVDPTKRVAGAIFTQILPFFDPGVLKLYGAFERGLYDGLSRA